MKKVVIVVLALTLVAGLLTACRIGSNMSTTAAATTTHQTMPNTTRTTTAQSLPTTLPTTPSHSSGDHRDPTTSQNHGTVEGRNNRRGGTMLPGTF